MPSVQQAGPSPLGSRPVAAPNLVALYGSPCPLTEPPLSGPFLLLWLVAPSWPVFPSPPPPSPASGMALNPAFPAFRNRDCFETLSASLPAAPLPPPSPQLSSGLTFPCTLLVILHLSLYACTLERKLYYLTLCAVCMCPGVGVSVVLCGWLMAGCFLSSLGLSLTMPLLPRS